MRSIMQPMYHVAYTREGQTFRLFVDGVMAPTGTSASSLVTDSSYVTLGAGSHDNAFSLNGWMDEIRITKGIARYTTNFTPPTTPFPNN